MSKKILIACAVVLLAAILGLAVADGSRSWKRRQLEFFELERRQLTAQLEAARAGAAEASGDLEAEIDAEEAALAGRRDEIAELEDDLRRFRGKSRAAEFRRENLELKARASVDGGAAAELTETLRQTRIEIESFAELITDREGKLSALRASLEEARERLAVARAPIEALETRLAAIPPPTSPLGGLFASGVAVREVSPAVSSSAGNVDRCVTCHLAAARDDLDADGWPAPFRGHPRPELFVAADSPHPYEPFGCTTCHGGDGRATDFVRAGHLPVPATPAWEAPRAAMLPLELIEAACGRCHGGEIFTPQAPILDQGRQLIAALGCTGCHESDHPALRGLAKAGPSLAGVAGKTTPAWAYARLAGSAGASRRIPHVLDPYEGATVAESSVEVRAVVDYLWQASRPADHEAPPEGDAEAGRALFDAVGCRGCHRIDLESGAPEAQDPAYGPHLAGVGSKVAAGWLRAWLLDPRASSSETSMPSLRLGEREAADLTAYLATRRNPAWESLTLPDVETRVRDRLVLSALATTDTLEGSQARLERMSEREKGLLLGERTIARLGCHGCHEIAGFEDLTPAGVPLREVGRRLRERLARGGAEVPGRWQPSSHRPVVYSLSDAEAHAVTVALLGLTGDSVPLQDERAVALAQGRRIVARYGCRGCHRIEGRGGASAAPGGVPADGTAPDLAHAGARLKASWVHDYLADPGRWQVRPWLRARMPSFGLSEAETNALARYFAMLDDRPLFAAAPVSSRPKVDVAVGRVIYGMLQCGDCHAGGNGESTLGRAPSYVLAAERLRPDWVVDWILDPEHWFPGTAMPVNFLPLDGGEPASDYLIGSIDAPMFYVESVRLLALLGSEEALRAYLSDPRRVASALRAYLWTLGE